MAQSKENQSVVEVSRPQGASSIVLVCEHASAHIPDAFAGLGLGNEARLSHIAWDPGALAVSQEMSRRLDAVLVASRVSRLVYDCNRPPEATDAMPARSEAFAVPGNEGLSVAQQEARVAHYYAPFKQALASELTAKVDPVLITLHSFTPVFHGKERAVEIGFLHDTDSRLADAFLAVAEAQSDFKTARNAPYGPQDGVTHTLKTHALPRGRLNVMIEVRNDLIATPEAQVQMGALLSDWTMAALTRVEGRSCKA